MNNWNEILAPTLQSEKMQEIKTFLKEQRTKVKIYPEGKNVFRAFDLCPFPKTRVVILGQDPYHTEGTADGLAFSTKQEKRPPSLEIIFKEIYKDLNIQYYYNVTLDEFFPTNNLEKWARNGFLLLNTALTVEEGKPGSHKDLGWEMVTKAVIEALNQRGDTIFLLWGKEAQKYADFIDATKKNVFFTAAHPAAELYKEDAGFLGCRHFSIVRDCIPLLEGRNVFPTFGLDACFDKDKAKEIVKVHYPDNAEKLCDYIDKELIIHIPINRDLYWEEIRKFEKNLSTKYE
jgi:uracil-DNA glycosylase